MSEQGKSFDPARLREFLEKSGFTIPKVELVVRGKVQKWNDMPALQVPGRDEVFVLAGGKEFAKFQREVAADKQVRVTGLTHPSHEDSPLGLTVEKFEILSGEN